MLPPGYSSISIITLVQVAYVFAATVEPAFHGPVISGYNRKVAVTTAIAQKEPTSTA